MFKGTVENKASTKPDRKDVFTAMSGKTYRRADVENPSRPGFLRDELVPILPDHWAAGSYFDLLTPTHRRMRPLPLSADQSRVGREQAPEALQKAVADAWVALAAKRRQIQEALNARATSEDEQKAAASAGNKQRYNRAVGIAAEAELRRQALVEEEHPLRIRVSEAETRLRWWLEDQALVKSGAVLPEEAASATF